MLLITIITLSITISLTLTPTLTTISKPTSLFPSSDTSSYNEEIAARIVLPPLLITICCRHSAIFGHLVRLGDEVPAHKALYSCVRLSQGRLTDPTWKRRPGRPRGRWIDQLRRDNNRPSADQ